MNTTFERRPLGLTIASLLIATAAAQAQEATQWRSENGGNGHWYQTVAV